MNNKNDISLYFQKVYLENTWMSDDSKSGPGSNKNSGLVIQCCICIVDTINTFFKNKEKITISDIPCGDFNCINILFDEIFEKTSIKTIDYYAYDIVPEIFNDFINLDKKSNVNYFFNILDITKSFPNKSDIILCKELFIHLKYNDIFKALNNFKNSNSQYLICSDSENIENKDITYDHLGECRHVSLCLDPFNLPKSLLESENYISYKIWDLNSL